MLLEMPAPRAKLRARRAQGKAERSLRLWPVLPARVPGDLLRIAEGDGGVAKDRLEDVSQGLVVVARVLVGEGLTAAVRSNDFGLWVVGVMANALIRAADDAPRYTLSGRRLGLGDRLDRVLTRHGRQRLTSWYCAATLIGPRRLGRIHDAPQQLARWLGDDLQRPPEVSRAREFFASDEFRTHLGNRRSGSSEYVALEAILSRSGARDFNTGERISTRRMFAPTDPTLAVDIHHLIPRKWSRVSDLRDDLQKRVDRLANLAPLAKATNILTGNREPASYIELFAQGIPAAMKRGSTRCCHSTLSSLACFGSSPMRCPTLMSMSNGFSTTAWRTTSRSSRAWLERSNRRAVLTVRWAFGDETAVAPDTGR